MTKTDDAFQCAKYIAAALYPPIGEKVWKAVRAALENNWIAAQQKTRSSFVSGKENNVGQIFDLQT